MMVVGVLGVVTEGIVVGVGDFCVAVGVDGVVVVGVVVVAKADDFPLERTANQSSWTPCPPAWPFFLSLTNV